MKILFIYILFFIQTLKADLTCYQPYEKLTLPQELSQFGVDVISQLFPSGLQGIIIVDSKDGSPQNHYAPIINGFLSKPKLQNGFQVGLISSDGKLITTHAIKSKEISTDKGVSRLDFAYEISIENQVARKLSLNYTYVFNNLIFRSRNTFQDGSLTQSSFLLTDKNSRVQYLIEYSDAVHFTVKTNINGTSKMRIVSPQEKPLILKIFNQLTNGGPRALHGQGIINAFMEASRTDKPISLIKYFEPFSSFDY